MHDSQIEEQLRGVLRAEGDGIPLTITAAELERRLAARRSATGGRRLSIVAAAVAAVVVVSMVAAGQRLAQAAGDRDGAEPQRLGRGNARTERRAVVRAGGRGRADRAAGGQHGPDRGPAVDLRRRRRMAHSMPTCPSTSTS